MCILIVPMDIDKISLRLLHYANNLAILSGSDVCLISQKIYYGSKCKKNEGLPEGKTLDSEVHKENALSIFSLLGINPSVPFL